MYLEISNIAAALGKNPYESREKMLLINWARHCPKIVLKYLLENKCIMSLGEEEETFTEVQKEIYKNISLPYYWSRHLILIFKEAMTNVAKHAKANDCEIKFYCNKDILKIELIDNGVGFLVKELKVKNGLVNIKKRASKINGKIELYSSKKGTSVTFTAKLPKKGS